MIDQILGSYRLESELGAGGMGTVYAATVVDRTSGLRVGTRVALKVVHAHLLDRSDFLRRFRREAEIGATVRHGNVVRTFHAGSTASQHFLVMEHVAGQTLRALIDELECVPEELCRHIGREVARGLAAIHGVGVVHRDIKPENVLITPDHQVKVMDLGVAQLQDELMSLSTTEGFAGSILYAAPEQFGKHAELDHRVDLHALGVLLYELACGRHPYYDEDARSVMRRILDETPRRISEIRPQVSPFYEEAIHRLLAKDREERFASAAAIAETLDRGERSEWWRTRSRDLRSATRRPLRRVRIPRETALYGRDTQLEDLRVLYEKASNGDGRVVLIEGEAGIGKTRLVDEFVAGLVEAGEDVNFVFGSYPPRGAATAAGALSTAFREHFGAAGSAPYLQDTPLLVPAFDAVLRGDVPQPGVEPLTTESLGTCFVLAMRGTGRERTTVLLIDDLHFAPDAARGMFTALALAVPGHRILLVGTMRPGVPPAWLAHLSCLDHVTHRTLDRLGPKDLAALLRDSLQSSRLAEELGFRIGVRTDGNPFFAFEIIRGLRDGQYLTRQADGSWATTRAINDIEIPSSVRDLVNARVADLSETDRDLLDLAACWGFEFDPTLIGAAAGAGIIETLKRFGQIERKHRLVRAAGPNYAFDHHHVQAALYEGVHEKLREHYHATLAATLASRERADERDVTTLDGALCVGLVEHFLLGARGDAALRYLEAACDHLEKGYLSAESVKLLGRALAAPGLIAGRRRVDLLLRKARLEGVLGRPDPQRADLDEALALVDDAVEDALDPRLRARALAALGWHHHEAARYREALDALNRARDGAKEAEDGALESQVTAALGIVYYALGRYRESIALHERHQALARSQGNRRGETTAMGNLGRAYHRLGRHDDARAQYELALAMASRNGYRRSEAAARSYLGTICHAQGRFEDARRHLERALRFSREVGHRRWECSDLINLGNVAEKQGRLDDARERHQRALEVSRETGDRRGEGIALHNLGNAWLLLGDVDRGRALLEGSRKIADEIDDSTGRAYCDWVLGEHLARCGSPAASEPVLAGAAARFRKLGSRGELSGVLVSLGSALADAGRDADARPAFEEALALAVETGTVATEVLAACHLALAERRESSVAAPDVVDRALQALAMHGGRLAGLQRAEAHLLLWRATGDAAQLTQAKRLTDDVLARTPNRHHATMIAHVPLLRDVTAAWCEHEQRLERDR